MISLKSQFKYLLLILENFVFQIVANCVVSIAVNTAGIWLHQLMETAQRKAFLDTRNCIAAKLQMEDENEKLVGFYSFNSIFNCDLVMY